MYEQIHCLQNSCQVLSQITNKQNCLRGAYSAPPPRPQTPSCYYGSLRSPTGPHQKITHPPPRNGISLRPWGDFLFSSLEITESTDITDLKGLAHAKIIKKSVILFWLLNMTIWCKHVHRLELQKFYFFSAAHLPVRLDIETKFPHFLFLTWLSIFRKQQFRLYI